MPYTAAELVIWEQGYNKGYEMGQAVSGLASSLTRAGYKGPKSRKPKRKLSAWNKFVKANSKKKIYRYANGKLKLKKMGIAFRKKKRR